MTPDYIDPAVGIPVALLLSAVYVVVRAVEGRRRHIESVVWIASVRPEAALRYAVQMWGPTSKKWPVRVREAIGETA